MSALNENLLGEAVDSMISGMFAVVLLQVMFGKSMSLKGIASLNTVKEGLKLGSAQMVYRQVGRPIVNNALARGGVDVKV
tara:strand:- start:101 stop:340 length:240 start_codon:yes stop_codon:yes gene_type:complete